MWEMAWKVYGDSLGEILSQALAGYKRSSGFDDLTRLYYSTDGHQALPVLREALLGCWPDEHPSPAWRQGNLKATNRKAKSGKPGHHVAPRSCIGGGAGTLKNFCSQIIKLRRAKKFQGYPFSDL